jgi:UDPglucose 6-dehydrogenase
METSGTGLVDAPVQCQEDGNDDAGILSKVANRALRVAVLGLGHVGLPTALGLAEMGWEVLGADSDADKIARLSSGDPGFYEPGISKLLAKHLETGRFKPVEDLGAAIRSASILFICVGTPQHESGEADLSQVESVARTIAHNLNGYKLIVEKSTVPAITAQWIKRTIQRYATNGNGKTGNQNGGVTFDVASNPEFLQEGSAIQNVFHPDRVICGVDSDKAGKILTAMYGPLQSPIITTDLNTAELIKHASNSFLAMKISFINMVADLCEAIGGDVTKVAQGIGLDPRIGAEFLQAGIGFGGYCFPKDLRAFIHLADSYGVDFSLLKEVEAINQRRIEMFLKKVRQALWVVRDKVIGVLGLAFKPSTDDIREAPGLRVVQALLDEGARLQLYDPKAMPNVQHLLPAEEGRIRYCQTPYEAARAAQALLVLTEWREFGELDLHRIRELMDIPVIVDGRNLFVPERVRSAGFEYLSLGR